MGLSFQPVACKAKSFWKKGCDLKKCFFNDSPSPTKSRGTSSQHYSTPRSSLSSLVSCSGHAPWVSYHCTFPQYVLFMEAFFLLLLTPAWHIALLIEILFFKVFSISLAQTSFGPLSVLSSDLYDGAISLYRHHLVSFLCFTCSLT